MTTADLTIGTSAGATAAAQIAGATPTELLAAILAAPRTHRAPDRRRRAPTRPVADHLDRFRSDHRRLRRRGRHAPQDGRGGTRRGRGVGRFRAGAVARHGRLAAARVSAGRTGRCSSRPSMPRPASRSCSTATAGSTSSTPSPPARLAAAPPTASATAGTSTAATGPTPRTPIWPPGTTGCWCCRRSAAGRCMPPEWGTHLATQVDELRAGGSRVETVFPDERLRAPVRRQRDGPVAAAGRRASRLRAGQSPRRAAHRVLALTLRAPA